MTHRILILPHNKKKIRYTSIDLLLPKIFIKLNNHPVSHITKIQDQRSTQSISNKSLEKMIFRSIEKKPKIGLEYY